MKPTSKIVQKHKSIKPMKVMWKITIEDEFSCHQYELEGPDDISVHTLMTLLKLDLQKLLK